MSSEKLWAQKTQKYPIETKVYKYLSSLIVRMMFDGLQCGIDALQLDHLRYVRRVVGNILENIHTTSAIIGVLLISSET